jgi:uncharacterized membrane protein
MDTEQQNSESVNVCPIGKSQLECKHDKIITQIQTLQAQERAAYEELQQKDGHIQADERKKIIARIEDIKKLRAAQNAALAELYSEKIQYAQDNSASLSSGVTMVQMVDEEIKQLENNLQTLKQRKRNKERMAEIGNYEQKRYAFRIEFLRVCTYTLVACFVILALHKLFLPSKASSVLFVIVLSIAGIKLGHMIYDGYMRDGFYFDKYNWPTNKEILQPDFDFDSSTNDEYYEKLLDSSQCQRKAQ